MTDTQYTWSITAENAYDFIFIKGTTYFNRDEKKVQGIVSKTNIIALLESLKQKNNWVNFKMIVLNK